MLVASETGSHSVAARGEKVRNIQDFINQAVTTTS